MTVANEEIPLPHGALPVTSNFIYWVVAVTVAMMGSASGNPVIGGLASLALIMQGTASMIYHGTTDTQEWAQLLDAVGIQWVVWALLGAGLIQIWPWSSLLVVPIVIAAWVLSWMMIDRIPRIPLIAVQAAVLVVMVGVLVGWPLALFLGLLIGAAFSIQQRTDSHSLGHTAWHLFSGLAQFIGARALLML